MTEETNIRSCASSASISARVGPTGIVTGQRSSSEAGEGARAGGNGEGRGRRRICFAKGFRLGVPPGIF